MDCDLGAATPRTRLPGDLCGGPSLASPGRDLTVSSVLVRARSAYQAFDGLAHRRIAAKQVQHLQQHGIAACAKHFPGIGHTTLDSHLDLPYLDKGRQAMDTFDLVPFRAAMAAGVYAVMLSHVVYTALDPQWPASLSKKVACDLLRGELGFQGVVLTDDLDMGAIAKYYDMDTITKQVLEAEVDIILLCHTLSKMEAAYDQVLSNIKSASEGKERSIRSVRRILRLKERCVV